MSRRVFIQPPPSKPSSRLLPRLPQPVDTNQPSGPISAVDISLHQNTSLHLYDQDVVRELSLPPASVYPSAPPRPRTQSHGAPSHTPASYLTSPHNVSIDSFNSRPRTPPVDVPPSSFFAQHGLPSTLPPPPRTTFYTQGSHPSHSKDPEVSNIASYFDTLLRGSYSKMLSQKPEITVPDSAWEPQQPTAAPELSLEDMLQADLLDAGEYLTSPLLQDESPEETPFLATPGDDLWNSPMVDASDDSFGLSEMPLFGAVVKSPTNGSESLDVLGLLQLYSPAEPSPSLPDPNKMDAVTPALDPLDSASLYTMPQTPAIPPFALSNSPRLSQNCHLAPPAPTPSSSSAPPTRPAKPLPTGTRRNITPASLVPLDAPTQPRQYIIPSTTSRKAIPAAFKGKKRARSEVDNADDDEDLGVDPDAIEAKRRQNTLAARRSRQRKLQHVRELEETVGQLTADRDGWMARAYDAEAKLRAHGIA